MCRNTTDFCTLTLYPATLLNSLIRSDSSSVEPLGFSIYKIISSANRDNPGASSRLGAGSRLACSLAPRRSKLAPRPGAPGPHVPGVVGLCLSLGFQSSCPLEGEASPVPRGHGLLVRNQEQLRVLPKCSERVHQSVTWIPSGTGTESASEATGLAGQALQGEAFGSSF